MTEFTPTPEQTHVVDLAMTGEHMAIDALAGSAKTTSCMLVAEAKGPSARGLYLTFNKAMKVEAESKFPRSVRCSTAHALAYRTVGCRYAHRLNGRRLKSYEIANRLNIDATRLKTPFGVKYLASGFLAGIVMKGVRLFSQSDDPEPTAEHIPTPDTMRDDRELMASWGEVRRLLEPSLRKAWADVCDPNGVCPYSPDYYLKLYSLDHPHIPVDYLLLDEAQDLSLTMLSIANDQRNHAQLVIVGDKFQSIYQWRGSIDAMQVADVAHRGTLTHSFRFGSEIAEQANRVLGMLGAPVKVTGRGPSGRVGPVAFPDVVLSRTNAIAVRRALDEIEGGGSPHIVGGAADVVSFARGTLDLQEGRKSYHADLACFDDWSEVRAYVESDELGGDLKLLVKLVDDFGADRIVGSLASMPAQEKATIILSTAHASKGREWSSVQLADDFPDDSDPTRPIDPSEKRLCYVAVTRAKRELDTESVGLLRQRAPRIA